MTAEEYVKEFHWKSQKKREWRGENPVLESALNKIFFGGIALTVAECYALDDYIDKLEKLLLDKEKEK